MVNVEQVEAKNGESSLRAITAQGRKVYLHSIYDPHQEAEDWAAAQKLRSNSVVVLFGLGLGYHLRALLNHPDSPAHVFVIEPNQQVITLVRQQTSSRDLLDDERVHVATDWLGFKHYYLSFATPWDNLFFCKIPAYSEVYRPEYLRFIEKLQREIMSLRSNLCTLLHFSGSWQKNFLKNLRYLNESAPVAPIFGQFSGKPVIIVSAGPSLMKNVDQLRQAKGKALIISVGTAARLLLHHGIKPDFVISFDGGVGNYEQHFRDLHLPDVPLIYDPAVHYKIVEEYAGPKAMMLVHVGDRWLERCLSQPIGFLRVGHSIANTAFDLAYRLGGDPIILVGQDIAYTDQKSHAAHTHGDDLELNLKPADTEILWVEGVEGDAVASDRKMITYLHWFEETIEALGEERTVVDATEGGAKIKGAKVIPLSEVLDSFCSQDLSTQLQALQDTLFAPAPYRLDSLLSHLKSCRNTIRSLVPHCRKGERLSKRLIGHYSADQQCNVDDTLRKLSGVDKRLKKGKREYELIHYLLTGVELLKRKPLGESDDGIQISQRSLELYSGLRRAFEFALPLIGESIAALRGTNPKAHNSKKLAS